MRIEKNKISKEDHHDNLIANIGSILEKGRQQAYDVVNGIIVKTHWKIANLEMNSKLYKYKLSYKINMIPSDPSGSLDESLFRILTNSCWGSF